MLINYLIVITITSVFALIWRALLLDHKKLLELVRSLPLVGGALSCGFCFTMWISLAVVLIYNPVLLLFKDLHWIIVVFLSWFLVSAGVLFMRNLLAVLMEANGVLTSMHRSIHNEEEGNEK